MEIDYKQSTKTRQESLADLDECCGGCTCEAGGGNHEGPIKQTIYPKKAGSFPWVSIR